LTYGRGVPDHARLAVDLDDLDALAHAFASAADSLRREVVNRFRLDGGISRDAFGVLGAGQHAGAGYESLRSGALDALGQLVDLLDSYARSIRVAAVNYRHAEQVHLSAFRGR
jgi:hypothetical protein